MFNLSYIFGIPLALTGLNPNPILGVYDGPLKNYAYWPAQSLVA